jgi:hypothetical protein
MKPLVALTITAFLALAGTVVADTGDVVSYERTSFASTRGVLEYSFAGGTVTAPKLTVDLSTYCSTGENPEQK